MTIRDLKQRIAKKLGAAAVTTAMMLPGAAILSNGFMFVGQTQADERIVNGSFEDASPTGWDFGTGADDANDVGFDTYNHTTNVYYAGDPIPASYSPGDNYGWKWGAENGSGQFGTATQIVDVAGDAGSSYRFSAWLSAYTQNDDYATINLAWADDSGAIASDLTFDGSNNSNVVQNADGTGPGDWTLDNWSLYVAEGTVPADATSAIVTIAGNALTTNGNDAYVDLVSLDIRPIPEPGSIALLGLGAITLLGLGRRQ